jgi:para-aminobenzoate synthetase component I
MKFLTLDYQLDVLTLLKNFSDKKDLALLHSASLHQEYGRYSYICFDAFANFKSFDKRHFYNGVELSITDPISFLKDTMASFYRKNMPELPPFQGGAISYFAYEAAHYFEPDALSYAVNDLNLPDIYLNFYDTLIAIDHQANKSWLIASNADSLTKIKHDILGCAAAQQQTTIASNLELKQNMTRAQYLKALKRIKEHLAVGDIFQANMTQEFTSILPENFDLINLYSHLVAQTSAPFSAFIKIDALGYILCASPERFISLADNVVTTCPIKGTCKRSDDAILDAEYAKRLLASSKDHAENTMIVDLMRNDLGKICEIGSIYVKNLCKLESFLTVHHLVSTIIGKLSAGLAALDIIAATFPPGSVTGAPKISAMNIITDLEQRVRGPYCGIMGYFAFNGDMDTAVLIRTYFLSHEDRKLKLYFATGGGIVIDSDPEQEYAEMLLKAWALKLALEMACG